MKTGTVTIRTPHGDCDSSIVYPEAEGQYPAILFLMDGFGPRDCLYNMARTLAARGYYVLLPNLFYRIQPAPLTPVKFPVRPEGMPELIKLIMPFFQSYTPELGVQDAKFFLSFLAQQKQVLPGKIGITGYCMGGGLALRIAARYPDQVAALASFHAGNLATEVPDSPHRLLNLISAELYIAHADHDPSMPVTQVESLHHALEHAGLRYEAERYAEAPHGFTMADLPAYREAALKRHWEKLFALFARTLGTPVSKRITE